MKKIFVMIVAAAVLAGCGEKTYQYTKDIVGAWSLQSMEYQDVVYPVGDATSENGFTGQFSWEFKDDGTYTASSTLGPVESDDFDDSLPFRANGEYKGYYLVSAPKGFRIREEYRGASHFSAFEIKGNEMVCQYTPNNSEDPVKLTFTKK